MHDTWNLISQRSPASALEQLEGLSRNFADAFAGKAVPLPGHWIEVLIMKADLVFEYTSSGYLGQEAATAENYLSKYFQPPHPDTYTNIDNDGSKSSDLGDEYEVKMSSCITNVSDDLWAMQSLSPPNGIFAR